MKLVTPKDKDAILRLRNAGRYGGEYTDIVINFIDNVRSGGDMLQEVILDDGKMTAKNISKIRSGISKAIERLDYEDDIVFFTSNYRCFLLWQDEEPVLADDPEQGDR